MNGERPDTPPEPDPTIVLPAADGFGEPEVGDAAGSDAVVDHAATGEPVTAPRTTPLWRRPLPLTAALLALLIVAVGAVWLAQQNAAGARDKAIRETAIGYFQALASGDSAKALGMLATQPQTKDLLTDDVLKASSAVTPLTDITVTGLAPRESEATVALTYSLGGERVAADLSLVGGGTSWKVVDGLSEIVVANTKGVRVNGAVFSQALNPVFPGTYTATPETELLALDGAPTVTIQAPATAEAKLDVTPRLSDVGTAQVTAAGKAALDACLATNVSAPEGCPWRLDETNVTVAPGSLKYTLTNDPWAGFAPTLNLEAMTASGRIHIEFDVTATVTTPDRTGELTIPIKQDTPITVDLNANPLKATWR